MRKTKFLTRKRGTPKQVGQKFPIMQKKKLPDKISLNARGGKTSKVCEYKDEPCYIPSAKICNEKPELCKRRKLLKKGMTQKQIDDQFYRKYPYLKRGGKYTPAYKWLEKDVASANAIEELVAHAGFTESEDRLKRFIKDSGATDVDAVFTKLLVKGVIKEVPSKSETWKYEVPVVTGAGRRKLHGSLYGELTPKEKAQMKKFKREGLL